MLVLTFTDTTNQATSKRRTMTISRSGLLLLLLVSASAPNAVSAKVRGGISNERDIDHRDLVEIVDKLQNGYDELKTQHEKLQEQYAAEKSERELQMQLPRSSCNCGSLTVEGEVFIGGDTIIHGDATLSGNTTTITGDMPTIQTKKTDIDGDMLTIQTSGAGTRTGESSAINVSGGVSSRMILERESFILYWRRLHVSLESSDVSHMYVILFLLAQRKHIICSTPYRPLPQHRLLSPVKPSSVGA